MAGSIVDMKPNWVENDNLQNVLIWKLWELPINILITLRLKAPALYTSEENLFMLRHTPVEVRLNITNLFSHCSLPYLQYVFW